VTPGWLNIGLILFAFSVLPLVVGLYFAVRVYTAWRIRQDVLRELVDLLDLACRRSLPFPQVLEGFAESLADRGADSGVGRFLPGRAGRLAECSERAFAFAGEVRAGGLGQGLEGLAITRLVPPPYLDWLRAGYARGSLPRTLETIRDGLRFDRRRRAHYVPLVAYVGFALLVAAVLGELSASTLVEVLDYASVEQGTSPAPLAWLGWALGLGWLVLVLIVLPLGLRRVGSRWRVLDQLPGLRRLRGLRVSANRLRLLECGLRAGLGPQAALELQGDAGDAVSARAARRVAEGEHPLRALGLRELGAGGAPFVELVGALAGEHERRHATRLHLLAVSSLPLGLLAVGLWAFHYHYTFFSSYSALVGATAPW